MPQFSLDVKKSGIVTEPPRYYAIGDIHGELQALKQILTGIEADLRVRPVADYKIIFLGDFVDRGENSRGVLDYIQDLTLSPNVIALKGNHEDMLLSVLQDPDEMLNWRLYGGLETLASFAVPISDLMRGRNSKAAHHDFTLKFGARRREFLSQLPLFYQSEHYYFCHAGIRPGVPLESQIQQDLLWIREPFLSHDGLYEKIIVHGHSPVEHIDVRTNRINIDTGAYLTGRLSCLILDGMQGSAFNARAMQINRIF